ncbi:MAG: hypothetical protein AVDCRST_MAG35-1494, partial [uncultured Quadrisphaera sp.]
GRPAPGGARRRRLRRGRPPRHRQPAGRAGLRPAGRRRRAAPPRPPRL